MLNIEEVSSGNAEEVTDYTGGGGFLWDTDVHDVTIIMCYGVKAASGSMALHFEFKNAEGKLYKEDCYFLSSKKKIEYPVKKDGIATGKTRHIPGFVTCANIIATAFPETYAGYVADENNGTPTKRYEKFFQEALSSMEAKTVPVWDWDLKKNVATDVEFVMTKIIGKNIKLAITKKLINKQAKNDKGDYVDTAEAKEANEISNAFSLAHFTAVEMLGGTEEAGIMDNWIENNKGKVIDKRNIKGNDGGVAAADSAFGAEAGAASADSAATADPTKKSLF